MPLTAIHISPGGALVGLRADDGGHVLAEQTDAAALAVGQVLEGTVGSVGMHTLTEPVAGLRHGFFVIAFGLSLDALRTEFA